MNRREKDVPAARIAQEIIENVTGTPLLFPAAGEMHLACTCEISLSRGAPDAACSGRASRSITVALLHKRGQARIKRNATPVERERLRPAAAD